MDDSGVVTLEPRACSTIRVFDGVVWDDDRLDRADVSDIDDFPDDVSIGD